MHTGGLERTGSIAAGPLNGSPAKRQRVTASPPVLSKAVHGSGGLGKGAGGGGGLTPAIFNGVRALVVERG